jgi:ABC-type polysaccharide/polyol phosphate export permease
MLIYTFVVIVLFNTAKQNYHIYVYIGLIAWSFFSGSVLMGTSTITRNKSIIDQVSCKKFIFPTTYLLVGLYQFLIGFGILILLMLFSGVATTWHFVEIFPITIVLLLFTYGFTLIVAHVGVYFFDLRNLMDIVLRLFFYLTPVMWMYETVKLANLDWFKSNPMSIIIESYRSVLLRNSSPDYLGLAIVLIVAFALITIGYLLIDKYEDQYGKVL